MISAVHEHLQIGLEDTEFHLFVKEFELSTTSSITAKAYFYLLLFIRIVILMFNDYILRKWLCIVE